MTTITFISTTLTAAFPRNFVLRNSSMKTYLVTCGTSGVGKTMAKEQLTTTQLTITEIAYKLGFEHPQSVSKLFKTKTRSSPTAFREFFN